MKQNLSSIGFFSWCGDQITDFKQLKEGRVCFGLQLKGIQPINPEKEGMRAGER